MAAKTYDQTLIYRVLEILYQADQPMTSETIGQKMGHPVQSMQSVMTKILSTPEVRSLMIVNKKGNKNIYWMHKKCQTPKDMYDYCQHRLSEYAKQYNTRKKSRSSRVTESNLMPYSSKRSSSLKLGNKKNAEQCASSVKFSEAVPKGSEYHLLGEAEFSDGDWAINVKFDMKVQRMN